MNDTKQKYTFVLFLWFQWKLAITNVFIILPYTCPAGIQRGPPADHQRSSPMVEEPAPAHQRRPEGGENLLPTGARGADVTLNWMSLSMRQSTPQEEKQAMNLMMKSGRGENKASRVVLFIAHTLSGLKRGKSLSNVDCRFAPSGPDLHSLI